ALVDELRAVRAVRDRALDHAAGIAAEALRAALVRDLPLLLDPVDDRRGALLVELARVGGRQADEFARGEDRGALHPEADAEVRDLVLRGPARRGDLALDAALAVAAGDEDAVHARERLAGVGRIDAVRGDLLDLDLRLRREPSVLQRL